MKQYKRRIMAGTVCAAAALFAGSASAETFFFNYGHTFIYSAFDSDAEDGDISANSFDFGIHLNEQTRMGVYAENITGDAASANVQGFMTEYDLIDGGVATSIGIMLGQDGNANPVSDIYGKFLLQASENSDLFAKVAYRGAPNPIQDGAAINIDSGGPDDHNSLYVSMGFGFGF